jgi:hypothetical protein
MRSELPVVLAGDHKEVAVRASDPRHGQDVLRSDASQRHRPWLGSSRRPKLPDQAVEQASLSGPKFAIEERYTRMRNPG